MAKITFQSAVLTSFTRNWKGGNAHFTSSMTKQVCSQLGWADIPEFLTGASPEGELSATVMELYPKEKELEKHGFDFGNGRVHKFEVVRRELEGKQGKGYRQEIHFAVAFTEKEVCRKLEQWMLTIGEGKGTLSVTYEPQPKQATLPGTDEKESSAE